MTAIYRSNIIQRMGGEVGFDFLVTTYCENIQDDERLDCFFGNFDLKTLICLQKEFLLVSFLEPYAETEPRKKRVMFRNDMMGIDGTIFALLEEHFVDALQDCCIGGLDFELYKAYFSELHALFKDCTGHSKYRENIIERMGGESTFDFLVVSFCERLEDDERLRCYLKDMNAQTMTLLQKELILIAFLNPSANNGFGALRRRVTSTFSALFKLGLNEEHFGMMESHFSAAVYECLSGEVVIEDCLRLFTNLKTFFEDNSLLSNNGERGEYEEENEDISIVSYTEFYEEDHTICSMLEGEGLILSPITHHHEAYVANRIQDAQSQSERSSDAFSVRSFESRTKSAHTARSYVSKRIQGALDEPYRPVHSTSVHSRTQSTSIHSRPQENEGVSYVSKRIQDALEKVESSAHSTSIHSRTHKDSIHSRIHKNSNNSKANKKDEGTSYISKRIQDVLDRSDASKHSCERTLDTLSPSSGGSKTYVQPPQVIHPQLPTNGRAKVAFSWKARSPFRRTTKIARIKELPAC